MTTWLGSALLDALLQFRVELAKGCLCPLAVADVHKHPPRSTHIALGGVFWNRIQPGFNDLSIVSDQLAQVHLRLHPLGNVPEIIARRSIANKKAPADSDSGREADGRGERVVRKHNGNLCAHTAGLFHRFINGRQEGGEGILLIVGGSVE